MGFIDKLKSGDFVQLCEINPPKGVEMNELYALADQLKGRIDAILITDMPSAVMRMGSLSASFLLTDSPESILIILPLWPGSRSASVKVI